MKPLKLNIFIFAVAVFASLAIATPDRVSANSGDPTSSREVTLRSTEGNAPDYRNKAYRVKKGDKFEDIALAFGLDAAAFAAWNKQRNPELIYVGQPLRLHPPDENGLSGPLIYVDMPQVASQLHPIAVPTPTPTPTPTSTLTPRLPTTGEAAASESQFALSASGAKNEVVLQPTTSISSTLIAVQPTSSQAEDRSTPLSTATPLAASSAISSQPESLRLEPGAAVPAVVIAAPALASSAMPAPTIPITVMSSADASRAPTQILSAQPLQQSTASAQTTAPSMAPVPASERVAQSQKLVLSPDAASLLAAPMPTPSGSVAQAISAEVISKPAAATVTAPESKPVPLTPVVQATVTAPPAAISGRPPAPPAALLTPTNSIATDQPNLSPVQIGVSNVIASAPLVSEPPLATVWQAAKPAAAGATTPKTEPIQPPSPAALPIPTRIAATSPDAKAIGKVEASAASSIIAATSAPASSSSGASEAVVATFPVKESDQIKVTDLDPTDPIKRRPRGGKREFSDEALQQLQELERINFAEAASTPPETAHWIWPLAGPVIAPFIAGTNNGIDLGGKVGDSVGAVADGRVVYAGLAVMGFGKLVVVRHTADYVSIYAHAKDVAVAEGQDVTKGQKVVEVGGSDSERPKLHFEIHFQGKPVDPQKTLPPR
jgi:lipoprotein NlpD